MTYTELITSFIALLALVISAVALRRAGRANDIAQEANELAQAPANLAKLQLEQEQARRRKTTVSLDIAKYQIIGANGRPTPSYRFRLSNDGESPAHDAGFEILTEDSPLVDQDYRAKLPATLRPKQAVEVLAAVFMDTPSKLDAVVFWTNSDGSEERHECVVIT